MSKTVLLAAAALLAINSSVAHATFVSGAARWHAMGVEHQHRYVTGMARQANSCAKRRHISAAKMSRAVSRYYSDNPARASMPKSQVFEMVVVRRLCR